MPGISSPISILIVDDNPGDVNIAMMALQASGRWFEFQAASSLTETKAILAVKCPRVILLDLALRDSHGFETIDEVIAACPVTPVIVVCGINDPLDFGTRAIARGAAAYISKDEVEREPGRLVEKVVHAIERVEWQREREAILAEQRQLESDNAETESLFRVAEEALTQARRILSRHALDGGTGGRQVRQQEADAGRARATGVVDVDGSVHGGERSAEGDGDARRDPTGDQERSAVPE